VINKCRKGILLAFFLSAPFLFPQSQSNSPEFLISRLIQSLQDQNLLEYYQHFAHDLREEEAASITTLFENFDLEEVTVALISMNRTGEKDAVAHMRSNFRNSYSVIMEIWKLELRLDNAEWFVAEKETVGNPQTMYSVSIPSSRVERVKAVVIQHADIRIAFEDALVFYDNIPEIETALFVMGEGRVDFEPSLEREQHQLELVYKDPYFKEKIEYAFIRCSHSFFSRNINIISYPEETPLSISEEEWTNVSFLFSRHYPRAFTVESPGLDSLLSVLPQGDEAVFDFKTRDKGVFSYIFSPFSVRKKLLPDQLISSFDMRLLKKPLSYPFDFNDSKSSQ